MHQAVWVPCHGVAGGVIVSMYCPINWPGQCLKPSGAGGIDNITGSPEMKIINLIYATDSGFLSTMITLIYDLQANKSMEISPFVKITG